MLARCTTAGRCSRTSSAQSRRSVLLGVIKNGNASTVAVVNGVREVLQIARAAAPPGLNINELFDQSKLVIASIASVLREGVIAAGLTGLMILLFLGSWRSTLIVLISIPLSMLTSIVILHFLGHTLNTMTLGGMALAVGIPVDDSTVTMENTHRLRSEGMKPEMQKSDSSKTSAQNNDYWLKYSTSSATNDSSILLIQ